MKNFYSHIVLVCFLTSIFMSGVIADAEGDEGGMAIKKDEKIIDEVMKEVVGQKAFASDMVLIAPKTAAVPKIDGVIEEKEWDSASSPVALIDGQVSSRSFSYPSSNVMFTFDDENLYIAFYSSFPRLAKIMKGSDRTDKGADVWGDESFEFHLQNGNNMYRFAGNVAGGHVESLNSSTAFSGEWKYKSTLRMQVDDTELWQGEIAIPFKTIGLTAPNGKSLKVNFCRTWRSLEHVGTTSLAGAANYNDASRFISLKFSDNAPAFKVLEQNDPSVGSFRQKIKVGSHSAGKFSYSVILLNSKGMAAQDILLEEKFSVDAGESRTLSLSADIKKSYYDSMRFVLKNDPAGQVLMTETIPFKISENYMNIRPAFSYKFILVEPRVDVLRNKLGAKARFSVLLKDSSGVVMEEKSLNSEKNLKLDFPRDNKAGFYKVALCSNVNGSKTIHVEKEFYYPGIGEYEKPQYDPGKVLPPFTPMKSEGKDGKVSVSMFARDYKWDGSLFPATVTSRGKSLLSAPIELLIDGEPVQGGRVELTKSSQARCELKGSAGSDKYAVSLDAWIEYDGVIWNSVSIAAKQDLKDIALRFSMPEKIAKYVHGAKAGFGADGGFTGSTSISREMEFFPVVWMGDEEKGLAWFAESSEGWNSKKSKPLRLFRENGNTSFQVSFADELKAESSLKLYFGFIATPAKPLPANYPLNTFGAKFAIHQNPKPPAAPTISSFVFADERSLRFGFFDLPVGAANNKDMHDLKEAVKLGHQNNAKCIPYMQPCCISEEYSSAAANKTEWEMLPKRHMSYVAANNKKRELMWLCPASMAAQFQMWKVKKLIKESDIDGLYFDFGQVRFCSNSLHGCNGRYPLLAMRNFYRGIANAFVEAGKNDYVITVHDSEAVQVPVFTFVTNLFNGENFRQQSSGTFHNGKDILDNLTIDEMATEFSSMPWGVTSSIYMPTTILGKQYGGGKEEPELYTFRMGKAFLAGSLIHNTIPALQYANYALFDKLIRIYGNFEVPKAAFVPYWDNDDAIRVVKGDKIYASAYRHFSRPELLLVVSHVDKLHKDQDVTISIDPAKFGFKKILSAEDMLAKEDPDLARLSSEPNRQRIHITIGDFGSTLKGLENNNISLFLKTHSFALIRVQGE